MLMEVHEFSRRVGSATECAAAIDLLAVRGLAEHKLCRDARAQLVRIVQMLTKLMQRFER